MRNVFIKTLVEEAATNPNIWLLCGDLGYSVLEPFIESFPDRYVNVGIAEQNMISVAAGLALSGKKVFVYSIINFATLRCYEQIRNDICYHNADVKVVGVGSGLSYGPQGYTHYAVEDIAVMRALPGMTVVCPGDPIEARWATRSLASLTGPGYLRLAKANEPVLHHSFDETLPLGAAIRMRDGNVATILATGNMLENALLASDILKKTGIAVGVVSMPVIQPFDEVFVRTEASRVSLIVTCEEHTRKGGLAEAVAFAIATEANEPKSRLLSFSTSDKICSGLVGDQNSVRRTFNLAPDQIAEQIQLALSERKIAS